MSEEINTRTKRGLTIERYFSREGEDAFETNYRGGKLEYELRTASIIDDKGNVIWTQNEVEVPKTWTNLALNITASKYFYGDKDKPSEREHSIKQVFGRVADFITDRGMEMGYFVSKEDAVRFRDELVVMMVNQIGLFNSPVEFNCGVYDKYKVISGGKNRFRYDISTNSLVRLSEGEGYKYPQAAACFIQSVDDNIEDIMRLASDEAMLFKYGSGTGTDLSTLRSTREKLTGGGIPSGPLSFMKIFDQVAAVIKSGGKTRRAAKMQSLKIWHPDIREFITCKRKEIEIANGIMDFFSIKYSEVVDHLHYQNANLSVRVDDEFMRAVESGGKYSLKTVTTGEIIEEVDARSLLKLIAQCAHAAAEPGLQYDTTINRWHTCSNSGRINASNPCSEYMFLDNSACNLASLNLMKFQTDDGEFDIESFKKAVKYFIIAQDILVDATSYPTKSIAENSHKFRALGLGYANLGGLIMSEGMPYDSEDGRAFASAITALVTGEAYKVSSELAEAMGSFEGFEENKEPMMKVISLHRSALSSLPRNGTENYMKTLEAAVNSWNDVERGGMKWGFRNAQVTLLAPTGTIGFTMDCDTTGIEPDTALIKYKKLVGGGMLKIVNKVVGMALKRLGYSEEQINKIIDYVDKNETIEGAPGLKDEHLPVFDCAMKAKKGKRTINYRGHLKMMAAVQPFLSGAISKTVNLPSEVTEEEIYNIYIEGWKMGLKALTVYRDGTIRGQPLTTQKDEREKKSLELWIREDDGKLRPFDDKRDFGKLEQIVGGAKPHRKRMPQTRDSITHKFEIAGHEGYITVGLYDDRTPGEIFITMAKEGTTVAGIMDAFGTAVSLCLQYGVNIKDLTKKFRGMKFDPAGFTKTKEIPIAKSIIDYIFTWLDQIFPEGEYAKLNGDTEKNSIEKAEPKTPEIKTKEKVEEEPVEISFDDVKDIKTKVASGEYRMAEGVLCKNCSTASVVLLSVDGCKKVCLFCHKYDRSDCGGA